MRPHLPMFMWASNAGGIMRIRSARRAVAIATIAAGCWSPWRRAPSPVRTPARTPTSSAKEKVTICHRTNSDKHPYVEMSVGAKGALKGHARHHAAKAVWSPG